MNINLLNNKIEDLKDSIIAVTLFEGETISNNLKQLSDEFEGKYNEIENIKAFIDGKFINVCLVGLGVKEKLDSEKLRVVGGNLAKKARLIIKKSKAEIKDLDIFNLKLEKEETQALIEGIILGNYKFDKYKTEKEKEIHNVNINTEIDLTKEIEKAELLAKSTIIARNLVNEPSNIIYPETLANEVVSLGEEYGFDVEIYEEDKIKDLQMNAFLAVASGSTNKPRFIVMRYLGDKENKEILGLVGKGLTYDSGGYSIKPNSSMLDMKTDMGGAASVIGAMCAISCSKLNKNVVAVIAACENSISGNAYKPGDIITSMSKKTIEILNTDAEGRLTLADAIYYIINNEKVTKVVDIATLTGAAVVALGSIATPIVTNDNEFFDILENASKLSGEKIWKMPVFDEYKKIIKGSEADLRNSGSREGGCITAGLFVGEFVNDIPWIHMDIAGTSVSSKSDGYKEKGATGEGVRTLFYLAQSI